MRVKHTDKSDKQLHPTYWSRTITAIGFLSFYFCLLYYMIKVFLYHVTLANLNF